MSAGFLNVGAGLGNAPQEDPAGEYMARQQIAKLLAGQGSYSDTSPKKHWMQALAQVADGAATGMSDRQKIAAQLAGTQAVAALGLPPGQQAAVAAGAAPPLAGGAGGKVSGTSSSLGGDIGRYAEAIKAKESGGNYGIVGPTHAKYGRALGAYQVMESNLPSWSKEAVGRVVSPDEFLKSPEIQDAVFAKKFGQSVEKYGNPQDAASVWFTGRPAAQGANSKDSLGTSGRDYVASFNRNLLQTEPARPGRVADAQSLVDRSPAKTGAVADAQSLATPAADPRADMPAADAEDASFLTGERDPNGGFLIPPADRALAPAGDPSALRPGDIAPVSQQNFDDRFGNAPPNAVSVAEFSPEMMRSPVATGSLPQQTVPMPPARPSDADLQAPMDVPLPPQRPSDDALKVPAPTAYTALPSPAAPAPRQQIAEALTPAPQGQLSPVPQNALERGMSGLQNGLDRIFGGPETQARLDAQAKYPVPPPGFGGGDGRGGILNRIADTLTPQPAAPAPQGGLTALGRGSIPQPTAPAALPGPTASVRLPEQSVTAGPTGPATAPVQQAPAPAAAPPAPDANVAWAQKVIAMQARGYPVSKVQTDLASKILEQQITPKASEPFQRDGGEYQRGPDGMLHLVPKDKEDKYTDIPAEQRAANEGAIQRDSHGKLIFKPQGQTINNNVDTKGAGKFAETANAHQAERYSKLVTSADEAAILKGDIDTLADLSNKLATGKTAEARLGIAQYAREFGLDNVAEALTGGKMSEMEAYQSIADKMTPLMRVPGSGSTSDREMAVFKNALPSLMKTPEGNAIVADTFRGLYDHKMAAGDIAGQALRQEIDQKEADKRLRELPSPFARLKEYRKQAGAAASAEGGNATPKPDTNAALSQAQEALKAGVPRAKVIERLKANGIDPSGL